MGADLIFIGIYATLAFLIAFLITPFFIKMLLYYGLGQNIREEAVDGGTSSLFQALHFHKRGTPTMGGVVIWGTVIIVVTLSRLFSYFGFGYDSNGLGGQSLLQRTEVYLPLFTLIVTALLGLFDDWLNVRGLERKKGLSAKFKMFWLIIFALIGALWFYLKLDWSVISIPFWGYIDLGGWYILFFTFIIVATANAVNITDGLDGLAGGLLAISFGILAIIAYFQDKVFLATFCAIIIGTLIAFLWFNVAPARFYMGDTGALSLGATLGVIVMFLDVSLFLPMIGFIFLLEASSSLIQLLSKRFRNGKQIFLIAPLHHHFEQKGWPETQVVMRFWLIGIIIAVISVILYFASKI